MLPLVLMTLPAKNCTEKINGAWLGGRSSVNGHLLGILYPDRLGRVPVSRHIRATDNGQSISVFSPINHMQNFGGPARIKFQGPFPLSVSIGA